jgi:parvulin-like peptidyl-prolyl isomerase
VRPLWLPRLDEVRDRLRGDAERQKLQDLATARLQQARARLDAGATLEEVAAELGKTVEETAEFGSGSLVPGLGMAPELVKAALAQPEGGVGGPVAVGGRVLVYQVAGRQTMDPAAFEAEKGPLREQLQQERADTLLAALVNARKQELGVSYDPPLLQTLGMTPGEAG